MPGEHLEQLGEYELFFADTGPTDAPTLIYLHGGPGYNSHSFQNLIGENLENYRVVYLDQRGCGLSEEPEADLKNFTVDALVSDLEAVRAFLGIEKFTPLGHGFGAVIALDYARQHPNHTERVIAVNPWLHFPELSQVLLQQASALSGKEPDFDDDTEMNTDNDIDDPEANVEKAFALLNAHDLLNALHFQDAKSRMRLEFADAESGLLAGGLMQEGLVANGLWKLEYPLYLAGIRAPIQVIAGAHDISSYPSQTDWLVDLSKAGIQVLDTGHYPWLDDPDEFAKAVQRIMESGQAKQIKN